MDPASTPGQVGQVSVEKRDQKPVGGAVQLSTVYPISPSCAITSDSARVQVLINGPPAIPYPWVDGNVIEKQG